VDETKRRSATGSGPRNGDLATDRFALDPYLRTSHGFLVDTTQGSEVGVVDEVVVDPATGRVVQLAVCGGWFGRRRRTITVEQVEGIDPLARRLVVSPSALQDEQL
jgi:sporulation protein YlmC with PRC-barrel domain